MAIIQETAAMTAAGAMTVRNSNTAYLNAYLSNFASATPLFASSTAGMTDTTRIYCNTTDGYLYTYVSGSWGSTGVLYQSTGLADGSVITTKIANSAVSTDKIADDSVATDKIQDLAITRAKIANLTVTADKIADGAVTTGKLADSAIIDDKIQDLAVTTAKIANSAITTDKIYSNAVTTGKIASAAVTTAKIADEAVTGSKVADFTLVGDKFIDRSISKIKFDFDTIQYLMRSENIVSVEDLDNDLEYGIKLVVSGGKPQLVIDTVILPGGEL